MAEAAQTDTAIRQRADPLGKNLRAVAQLERNATLSRSIAARVCDQITLTAGTTWSIAVHAVIFIGWIGLNLWALRQPFDAFPFMLLTTMISVEAIFLNLFILASQNRMTREADKRAHMDLQVNLLAEQEMTLVLKMLAELCDHAGVTTTSQSTILRGFVEKTDIRDLADRVEREITPSGGKAGDMASSAQTKGRG